jgi:DNA-nicking Smr family endonuclease
MLKTGDNVRFLNAVGGGIVKRIDERQGIVYVEDTDGFEMPVLIKECVVVPKVSATTNVPIRDVFTKKEEKQQAYTVPEIVEQAAEKPEKIEIVETDYGDALTAFLAFFAKDLKQLQTSNYECLILNDSNYFLFYNIVIGQNGDTHSIANGIVEPNIQQWLTDIQKEDLNDWENVHIQIVAYKKDKSYAPQKAIDFRLKIDTVKFYKLHSFSENDYFDEPAMLVNLTEQQEKEQLKSISPDEIRQAMLQKQKPEPRKQFAKKPKAEIFEIDLHINALLDTTVGLSNADMLNFQMQKFHETLAKYKDKRGQRIVFIHGKGEGVLRSEIEKSLKSQYKSYYFQDASFQKYGFGATMVMIR